MIVYDLYCIRYFIAGIKLLLGQSWALFHTAVVSESR
jgi:hypothetical protein